MIHLPPKVLSSSFWQVSWLSLHRAGRLPNLWMDQWLVWPALHDHSGGAVPDSHRVPYYVAKNNTRSNNKELLLRRKNGVKHEQTTSFSWRRHSDKQLHTEAPISEEESATVGSLRVSDD